MKHVLLVELMVAYEESIKLVVFEKLHYKGFCNNKQDSSHPLITSQTNKTNLPTEYDSED